LYFEGLRHHYKIPSVELTVVPSRLGTSPIQVVQFAEMKANSRSWDEVWCVFDRDDHPSFEEARQAVRTIQERLLKKRGVSTVFRSASSVPCFELWFLIHFEKLARSEPSQEVQKKVKKWVSDYDKGVTDMWARLVPRLAHASDHAKILRSRVSATGDPNPSTDVDLLVDRLISLRRMP
jgi:hypothetical protein